MGMFASVVAGVEWREGRVAGRKARRLLSLETRRPAELNLRCVMALKSLKVHEQRLKVHACIRAPLIFPILAVSLQRSNIATGPRRRVSVLGRWDIRPGTIIL